MLQLGIYVRVEGMLFCIVAPFQNARLKYFFFIIIYGMALIICHQHLAHLITFIERSKTHNNTLLTLTLNDQNLTKVLCFFVLLQYTLSSFQASKSSIFFSVGKYLREYIFR